MLQRGATFLRERLSGDGKTDETIEPTKDVSDSAAMFVRCAGCVAVVFAFYLNVHPMCPRYYLVLYPLYAIGLLAFAQLYDVPRRAVGVTICLLIGWNIVNHNGALYLPAPPPESP